jgi:hypothetical protein
VGCICGALLRVGVGGVDECVFFVVVGWGGGGVDECVCV